MTNAAEKWKPVVGYERYYSVSSLGRVRSERRGRLLRIQLTGRTTTGGQPRVTLSVGGNLDYALVSKLVAEAFLGPRPDGLFVRHKNDDSSDNRLENIYYGERYMRTPAKDFTPDELDKILRLAEDEKVPQKELAQRYGVSPSVISRIVRARRMDINVTELRHLEELRRK